MKTPLEGLRVLDFSRVLAGPYCSMMMGDMGAEVIKVEEPGKGDDTRSWGPPFQSGESTYFLSVNRNKKSVTLNLKAPGGRAVAQRLAAVSDVLLENFRPGTMDRLGLGYAQLRPANRKLVYCSISGFGQTGPERERPGYDAMIQGEGGLMSITGFPDGPPTKVGVSIADLVAGMLAFHGILLALRVAEKTGQGQWVDISLLDGQVGLLTFQAQAYFATGKTPRRWGNAHSMITPYETYATADGYVIIAVGTDDMWRRFARLMDLPADGDFGERFATSAQRVERREELAAILKPRIARRTTAEWIAMLQEAGIPCGRVRDVAEVLGDPHVLERALVQEMEHAAIGKLRTTGIPIKLSATPGRITAAPPLLGADTDQVLATALGMTAAEIARLREDGAL
jgi:formyl-CoA transferase/CoA:oxalate CoA-transferase